MRTKMTVLALLMTGCAAQVEPIADAADAGPVDAAQVWIDSPLRGPYNEGDAGEYRASWLEVGDH